MWDAQLLRSILLELGLTKENPHEKQRTKLQRIISLRKYKNRFFDFFAFLLVSKDNRKGMVHFLFVCKENALSTEAPVPQGNGPH